MPICNLMVNVFNNFEGNFHAYYKANLKWHKIFIYIHLIRFFAHFYPKVMEQTVSPLNFMRPGQGVNS